MLPSKSVAVPSPRLMTGILRLTMSCERMLLEAIVASAAQLHRTVTFPLDAPKPPTALPDTLLSALIA